MAISVNRGEMSNRRSQFVLGYVHMLKITLMYPLDINN